MFSFICGQWHVWESNNKILLSNEDTKQLREFSNIDDTITWLYVNDYKPAARALHKAKGNK